MGLLVWDFFEMSDVSLSTMSVTKTSPTIPTQLPGVFGSSHGVATRHTDGSIYVIASLNTTSASPVIYELNPDWTTWTGVGPQWDAQGSDFSVGSGTHFGAARVGSTLVTISLRNSSAAALSVIGWDFAGNQLWEHQFLPSWDIDPSDRSDESFPECLTTDGTNIFWTTEGANVWSFNCVTHNSDPIKLIYLLSDSVTYSESGGQDSADHRTDVDLQGAVSDGTHVYAWGGQDNLAYGSDTNHLYVFQGLVNPPSGPSWTKIFTDPDTTNALQRTSFGGAFYHASFSGTSATDGTYLYMLNDSFGPYVARLHVASPVGDYEPHFVNVGNLINFPSALVAVTPDPGTPNLTGALGGMAAFFWRPRST